MRYVSSRLLRVIRLMALVAPLILGSTSFGEGSGNYDHLAAAQADIVSGNYAAAEHAIATRFDHNLNGYAARAQYLLDTGHPWRALRSLGRARWVRFRNHGGFYW